jgi:hypothetical protein
MYRFLSIISVLIIISTVPIISAEVIRGESTVPDWIKNTAGWWASEQIPDAAFLQGIQYLIKERIIVVEIPTEIDSQAAEEVPGWVKNTVGWWAEDKIHDTTFVSGIQYLISKGIMVVMEPQVEEAKCNFKGKEVVCSLTEKEVVEINDFYMEVNRGNCTACLNWAYVGEKYYFQIETFGENHWNHIDGVTVTAKIISKGGELRHDFGEVTTDDGIYKNSIIIPNMDWYAGNILSVTGTYYGVEKTIEKEFEVFKNQGGTSGSSRVGAGGCAHVGPVSINTWEIGPQGIVFSKSGEKMFLVGYDGDDVNEFTLTGPYCIATLSFVDSFDVSTQTGSPTDLAFNKAGDKMYVMSATEEEVYEYKLSVAWDVSSASLTDSFDLSTEDSQPRGIEFSKSGKIMFILGSGGDEVNQYDLSIAWDVSTASASCHPCFAVLPSHADELEGLAFNKAGDKMFITGYAKDRVWEYELSVPWDVSTASLVGHEWLSVSGQDGVVRDLWFDSSGKTMFLLGDQGADINVYKLTTAWDVSTASFVG